MEIQHQPYPPERSVQAARRAGVEPSPADPRLFRVCQEFEALFIKQMLNAMRQSIPKSGFLGGSLSQEFFEDMLYEEYAKKMAENGRFGIASLIYRQLQPNG